MGKYDFIVAELESLKAQGMYNIIRTIESPVGAWTVVDGKKVLNMCSNNYLGFANDPELKRAAIRAIEEYGVGPAAVRSIAGTMSLHRELERKLAEFKGCEDAVTFQSGFCANLATIPLIAGPGAVIFTDELNHASIIDGCRLTKAERVIYPHLDVSALAKALEEKKNAPVKLIVTDGVFSMDGDLAPLPEIVELAERYEAIVMVDDAHGEGVLGSHGRGIVDHFGLHGRVDGPGFRLGQIRQSGAQARGDLKPKLRGNPLHRLQDDVHKRQKLKTELLAEGHILPGGGAGKAFFLIAIEDVLGGKPGEPFRVHQSRGNDEAGERIHGRKPNFHGLFRVLVSGVR